MRNCTPRRLARKPTTNAAAAAAAGGERDSELHGEKASPDSGHAARWVSAVEVHGGDEDDNGARRTESKENERKKGDLAIATTNAAHAWLVCLRTDISLTRMRSSFPNLL